MSEYLDRDKLLEQIDATYFADNSICRDLWALIMSIKPADVVPVVRCYECERFIPFMKDERGFCSEHHIRAYPIGYCSNGVKVRHKPPKSEGE